MKGLSVVVPCYEEALNIRPLCERISLALKSVDFEYEVILVDDFSGRGTEDTRKVVKELISEGLDTIHLFVRLPEEGKGLSTAVLFGLEQAKFDINLVMDADLQHEPESILSLVSPLFNESADFVFGSRHVAGGSSDKFSPFRKIVSWGATVLAYGLTTQTDPMSGFFAFKQTVLKSAKKNNINPVGYKIGLEILVRSQIRTNRVLDVPIKFQDRVEGESKLSAKQYVLYLMHLGHLYWFLYAPIILLLVTLLLVSVVILFSL